MNRKQADDVMQQAGFETKDTEQSTTYRASQVIDGVMHDYTAKVTQGMNTWPGGHVERWIRLTMSVNEWRPGGAVRRSLYKNTPFRSVAAALTAASDVVYYEMRISKQQPA